MPKAAKDRPPYRFWTTSGDAYDHPSLTLERPYAKMEMPDILVHSTARAKLQPDDPSKLDPSSHTYDPDPDPVESEDESRDAEGDSSDADDVSLRAEDEDNSC